MRKGKSSNRYRTVTIDHKKTYSRSKIEVKKITFLTVFLLCLTIGTSYAFLTQVITGTKVLSIVSGTFKIDFNDGNEINIENAQPITNEEGLNTDGYTFTITNNGSIDAKYKVTLEEKGNNTLNKEYIRYSYKKKNGTYTTPKLLSEGLEIISNEELNSGAEEEYTLKLWMDYDTPNEGQNKTFKARIIVDSTQKEKEVEEEKEIELLGEKNITIVKNSTYVDPGYVENESVEKTYEYYDGTNLTTVESIDTSKVGIYYIHYKKEINGIKKHEVRVVNVVEEEKELPEITLIGEEEITIGKGTTYEDLGYTSSDQVITIGEVNTKIEGTYTIRYIAIKNNHFASVVRVVNIVDKRIVTYNYTENGGTKEKEEELVTIGDQIDLTRQGTKEGYAFIGWNTDKNAHEGLENIKMTVVGVTLYAIYEKEITITFDKNATASTTTTKKCTMYNNDENCSITSPDITATSGYTKIGWAASSGATSSSSNVNTTIIVSTNTTYYAIQSRTITISFNKNATSGTTTSKSCTMYNENTTCSITSPDITAASGYTKVGWATSSSATSSVLDVNTESNVSASTPTTYYAIQKRTITISFNKNATSGTTTSKSCTMYNENTTCSITSPDITATSGYSKVGWSTSSSATSSGWNVNTASNVSASTSTTYYAIQKKTITITFAKGTGISSIGSTGLSCTMYNNGTTCSITMPTITVSSGYNSLGWQVTSGTLDTSLSTEPTYYTANTSYTINSGSSPSITMTAQTSPIPNYGSSIASSYSTIYYIQNNTKSQITNTTSGTWKGNYTGTYGMTSKITNNGSRIVNVTVQGTHNSVYVTSGTNTVNFTSTQSNKWVYLYWHWGCYTYSGKLGAVKLIFNNGNSYTIQQAVTNGYIEPLVTYISADTNRTNDMSYVLNNPEQIITGGTQTKAYSNFSVCFKVKNVSPLKGVTFTSNGYSSDTKICNDGFDAYSNSNIEFSL